MKKGLRDIVIVYENKIYMVTLCVISFGIMMTFMDSEMYKSEIIGKIILICIGIVACYINYIFYIPIVRVFLVKYMLKLFTVIVGHFLVYYLWLFIFVKEYRYNYHIGLNVVISSMMVCIIYLLIEVALYYTYEITSRLLAWILVLVFMVLGNDNLSIALLSGLFLMYVKWVLSKQGLIYYCLLSTKDTKKALNLAETTKEDFEAIWAIRSAKANFLAAAIAISYAIKASTPLELKKLLLVVNDFFNILKRQSQPIKIFNVDLMEVLLQNIVMVYLILIIYTAITVVSERDIIKKWVLKNKIN
ncbi:MAG: hypothetical protein MRZ40_01220 [Ligilactobacillus animalis]|uniref:hypothetical protein n=1 Tax=Ligilactobacillus animalis TaxID=1605 RepID=UPI00242D4260|nr:hypothetical protein [Ligilactobacillus animalis]MCI5941171.1 hypothetical protein [Ligilactobacillus animalis]MDY2994086.1 hypothetical protein [Ligilactobacillus animalis]